MTPAQLAILKAEVQSDPLGLGYAPFVAIGNDTAVAELLNARNYPGPVPYAEFQPAMLQMPCWGKIRVAAATAGIDPALLGLCFTAIDLLTKYAGATVDLSLPALQAALNGLGGATLVSADEKAAILALAASRRGRAEVLVGQAASEGDVARAIRG